MDSLQLWRRYCKYFYHYPQIGFSLDISRIRFPNTFFTSMQPAIDKALEAMSQLEKGAIANPDEQRMVGHYWLRDSHLAPSQEIKTAINGQIQSVKDFAKAIHSGTIKPERSEKFTALLLIGIGGSALGPQLVADALWDMTQKTQLFVCDNTDPDGISRIIAEIGPRLESTLVIATSKSGGTPETRNGVIEFANCFKQKGLNFSKHAIAVTTEGSKFDNQAKAEGWLKQFYIWDWVGGRTSVFSAVGLVPAALLGIDIDSFLTGAKEMDQITRTKDYIQNPAALLSLMWHFAGEGKGKKDMVVLPYKDRLLLMSKYLQQLVMESLGKEKDLDGKIVNQGIAVYGNKGSTDQHAYVQQLRDGVNNFFATFIEVLNDDFPGSYPVTHLEVEPGVTCGDYLNGFFQGTRRALFEGGRDSITITIDTLNPKSLGALIALFERAVGFYATLVNINAYHQPGVEAGKKTASKVIEVQKALLAKLANNKSPLSAQDLAQAIGSEEEIETVYKILEHLAANPHRRIKRSESRLPLEAKYFMR